MANDAFWLMHHFNQQDGINGLRNTLQNWQNHASSLENKVARLTDSLSEQRSTTRQWMAEAVDREADEKLAHAALKVLAERAGVDDASPEAILGAERCQEILTEGRVQSRRRHGLTSASLPLTPAEEEEERQQLRAEARQKMAHEKEITRQARALIEEKQNLPESEAKAWLQDLLRRRNLGMKHVTEVEAEVLKIGAKRMKDDSREQKLQQNEAKAQAKCDASADRAKRWEKRLPYFLIFAGALLIGGIIAASYLVPAAT